jgi:D-alanyl-D-alanine carboxypeptidase (penicillin-binding protein 5/6)
LVAVQFAKACVAGLIVAWSSFASVASANPVAYPQVKAQAAVVIDAGSGQVLYEKNAHVQRAPASTTKIMTSLLAIESGRLDEWVTVSKRAASVGESTIYLKEGERLTLRDLTYGVLLNSGNDASTAVAEYLGSGSEARFVEAMNRRVAELGLRHTHFSNPHGLPSENHYSSAYDLAMILREASTYSDWRTIAQSRGKRIPFNGKPDARLLRNHNKLLWRMPEALGGKTGYTVAAGRCFVGSARRDGRLVIESTLGSSELWDDSQRLLQFGLSAFENVTVVRRGEIVGTVPIQAGSARVVEVIAPRDVQVSVARGALDLQALQQVWQLPDELRAPVDQNQPVGQLVVRHGARVLQTVPLVAAQAVPLGMLQWGSLSSLIFPGVGLAGLLTATRIVLRFRARLRARRRRARARRLRAGGNTHPATRKSAKRAS